MNRIRFATLAVLLIASPALLGWSGESTSTRCTGEKASSKCCSPEEMAKCDPKDRAECEKKCAADKEAKGAKHGKCAKSNESASVKKV